MGHFYFSVEKVEIPGNPHADITQKDSFAD